MYKYHNNLLPDLFDSYFTKNIATHDHETRERNFFRIPEYKTNLGKPSIRYTRVKMWFEVIESKIDVECSQSVFEQNLKQCLIEKIVCLHCSKMQCWFVVFFLLFCLTFVTQANRIPFVTLCCTFRTINEIVSSESAIGTHKPKRFQSHLSHTSVSTTEYVILVLFVYVQCLDRYLIYWHMLLWMFI